MRLTTKGRYAVTAMLDLSIHSVEDPVCLADIAARQRISLAYLEQLFAKLRRAGLVKSVRGPGGGYRLNKAANEVSAACVIAAVNESIDATRCEGRSDCQQGTQCITHQLWSDLSDEIQRFLQGVTLADLIKQSQTQAVKPGLSSQNNHLLPTTSY